MIYDEEVLTILTTATELPEETGSNYREVFSRLGVKNINVLNINTRESANNKKNCNLLKWKIVSKSFLKKRVPLPEKKRGGL